MAVRWLAAVIVAIASPLSVPPADAQLGRSPAALVLVRPQPSGPPGSAVSVVGIGFDDAEAVEVRWGTLDGGLLGSAAGPDFVVPITVPDLGAGLYSIIALSRRSDGGVGAAAATAFLVTPRGSAAPGDPFNGTTTTPQAGSADAATPTPGYLWAVIGAGLVALALAAAWGRFPLRGRRDS